MQETVRQLLTRNIRALHSFICTKGDTAMKAGKNACAGQQSERQHRFFIVPGRIVTERSFWLFVITMVTAFLLTTLILSFESFRHKTMDARREHYQAVCWNLDRESAAALAGTACVETSGQVLCGPVVEKSGQQILPQAPDDDYYRLAQVGWQKGRAPESAGEAALTQETLQALGQPSARIGDRIRFPQGQELTLCGIACQPERGESLPVYLTWEGLRKFSKNPEAYAVFFRFQEGMAEDEQMLRHAAANLSRRQSGGTVSVSEAFVTALATDLLVPGTVMCTGIALLLALYYLAVSLLFFNTL